jgi:hypothetical protein
MIRLDTVCQTLAGGPPKGMTSRRLDRFHIEVDADELPRVESIARLDDPA